MEMILPNILNRYEGQGFSKAVFIVCGPFLAVSYLRLFRRFFQYSILQLVIFLNRLVLIDFHKIRNFIGNVCGYNSAKF